MPKRAVTSHWSTTAGYILSPTIPWLLTWPEQSCHNILLPVSPTFTTSFSFTFEHLRALLSKQAVRSVCILWLPTTKACDWVCYTSSFFLWHNPRISAELRPELCRYRCWRRMSKYWEDAAVRLAVFEAAAATAVAKSHYKKTCLRSPRTCSFHSDLITVPHWSNVFVAAFRAKFGLSHINNCHVWTTMSMLSLSHFALKEILIE